MAVRRVGGVARRHGGTVTRSVVVHKVFCSGTGVVWHPGLRPVQVTLRDKMDGSNKTIQSFPASVSGSESTLYALLQA